MWKVLVRRLPKDEEGQDLVEYAFAAVVIGLGTAVALHGITGKIINVFNAAGNAMTGH